MHDGWDESAAHGPDAGTVASQAIGRAVAELRRQMGADLAWFCRVALVPADPAPQLWWSGIWAAGHGGACAALRALDDRPAVCERRLASREPRTAWRRTILEDAGEDAFWERGFAQSVYRPHNLHEEHRVAVTHDGAVLGFAAVAWDTRRAGVTRRLGKSVRNGAARWMNERVALALAEWPRVTGALVCTEEQGVLFASPDVTSWLTRERSARLCALVRHRPAEPLALAMGGCQLEVSPVDGPLGQAWLAQLRPLQPPRASPASRLTPSQAAVVELVLAGCTAPEIARELAKSVETVRSQIKTVYARLGVASRLELARALGRTAP